MRTSPAASSSSSVTTTATTKSGILAPIIRENSIFLGGSSMGKGFRRAARFYLRKEAPLKINDEEDLLPPSNHQHLLNDGVEHRVEEPFYVVDVGMIVSQLYQWKQYFPRVEPFYAVKCNPDKVILKTLATLGCNFDCASRNEMRLVQDVCRKLPKKSMKNGGQRVITKQQQQQQQPEIIFANPCKSRSHIIEAVCRGVTMMTFDNVAEVKKCASVSKEIKLILRIITDDSGSQCRLSSKFGAPRSRWHDLLKAAKQYGLDVIGVSFHVGSGCKDATRYDLALKDARELFDLASKEYGFNMTVLDIGGGFPGETHSLWNPVKYFGDPTAKVEEIEKDILPTEVSRRKYTIDEEIDEESVKDDGKEGKGGNNNDDLDNDGDDGQQDGDDGAENKNNTDLVFFQEIAESIVPVMDELFPPESGVRIIAEPGRYLVAASTTLCTSIIGVRSNVISNHIQPSKISDADAAFCVDQVTRADEDNIVAESNAAKSRKEDPLLDAIVEGIGNYSEQYTRQNLTQQEFDVYVEKADFTTENLAAKAHLLAPPQERLPADQEMEIHHTVEGMQTGIVASCAIHDGDNLSVISELMDNESNTNVSDNISIRNAMSLMAAGEAAVSGVVFHAIADTAPCQDDYAYYVNDGCYGGFNNLIFDHAMVRPRRLKNALSRSHTIQTTERDGFMKLEAVESTADNDNNSIPDSNEVEDGDDALYPSTVFGPTCDSIDVISRSVLLPKMSIGDWLYFQNMGAYTSAAASDFNGFTPTEKFYVCSVQPEHFEDIRNSQVAHHQQNNNTMKGAAAAAATMMKSGGAAATARPISPTDDSNMEEKKEEVLSR